MIGNLCRLVGNRVAVLTRGQQTAWVSSSGEATKTSAEEVDNRKNRIPNNQLTTTAVHNRNPRNLEKLRIGDKPIGWNADNPGKSFWNKVILELSAKHVVAKIKHFEGYTPVSASTREWAIKSQLYSTKDHVAVETVARVLTRRALQAGITEVFCYFNEEDSQKEKVQIFQRTLKDSGLSLSEPDQIEEAERTWLHHPTLTEKAWEVFEELDEKVITKIIEKRKQS